MYLMKIKGVNRMPDFIQVRDDRFTLIGVHRADRPQMIAAVLSHAMDPEELRSIISELPYGILKQIS